MALKKRQNYRKVMCKYGERAVKLYTFLCTEELFATLEENDFALVDSEEEYRIVRVVEESTAELESSIDYKHILKKL